MRRSKSHKKCSDKLDKRMRDCMNVIRPTQNKKLRNSQQNFCPDSYICDLNMNFTDQISLDNNSTRQGSYSPEQHRYSFDSYDINDIFNFEIYEPVPIPPTYNIIPTSTPMQDYMTNNKQDILIPISINDVSNGTGSLNQTVPVQIHIPQQSLQTETDKYLGMNNNRFDTSLMNPSPPVSVSINTTISNTVSPSLQFNTSGMPSRPNPPSFLNGPQYFKASSLFRVSFKSVDVDDSQFITLEELKAFLVNRDGSSFNNEAAVTIMGMFDKNKDYKIDSDEFPDMLTFMKNWDSYFIHLDSDGTGTLDFCEMMAAIKCLGLTNLSDTFMTDLLQKYARADDKRIHFDNFILICVTLCRYEEGYRFMKQNFGNSGFDINLEKFIDNFMNK